MVRGHPGTTRTDTLFPCTPLFRSQPACHRGQPASRRPPQRARSTAPAPAHPRSRTFQPPDEEAPGMTALATEAPIRSTKPLPAITHFGPGGKGPQELRDQPASSAGGAVAGANIVMQLADLAIGRAHV